MEERWQARQMNKNPLIMDMQPPMLMDPAHQAE